jgi:hypothetical protein
MTKPTVSQRNSTGMEEMNMDTLYAAR